MTAFDRLVADFPSGTNYLAACTGGLPTRTATAAMRADLDAWSGGTVSPTAYGAFAERARVAFARIVGVGADRVALGSQTSVLVSVIAAAVPDGAEVLCVDGDFSSIVAPFASQSHRGVRLREVPLDSLAEAVNDDTWLVAYSLVQSATGELADDDLVVAAARAHGARTLVDLTQAAGVLPVDAGRYDATVTHAYKWLCSPRGVAFLTLSEAFEPTLRPIQAGWYAGADVWASCYGAAFELARDARRFDVSPAWQAVVGAAVVLEQFAEVDAALIWAHASGLGDALCDALEIPRQGRAIVTWADPEGSDLALLGAAGITASGRAGRARVAFHLWNTPTDVAAVAAALGSAHR